MSSVIPPIPAPPHDPLFTLLGPGSDWRIEHSRNVDAGNELALSRLQPTDLPLADQSGTFAGLAYPTGYVVTPDGRSLRTDSNNSTLQQWNACTGQYEAVACTGGSVPNPRNLLRPQGLAVFGGRLYVCDSGNGRISVFLAGSFQFSGHWTLPSQVPWEPFAIAFSSTGLAYVSDTLNRAVHVFDSSGYLQRTMDIPGGPRHLLIDDAGNLYITQNQSQKVLVYSPQDNKPGEVEWLTDVRPAFCKSVGIPEARQYADSGSLMTSRIDSRIDGCVWHRIVLKGIVPPGTRIVLQTFTSDQQLTSDSIPTDDSGWTTLPVVQAISARGWDASITSEPGRYLWLRVLLFGTNQVSPTINSIRIEYPRISLRRWLPAIFGAVPRHADFTDRFLGVFDAMFRSLEANLDNFPRYLDARGAPADRSADWLAWLAGWLGIELDRTWPEPRRREWLRQAAILYHRRGTPEGLRRHLLLLLGWQNEPHAPQLVLEHFRLGRWTTLGTTRLGSSEQLWGRELLELPPPRRCSDADQTKASETTSAALDSLASGGPPATYAQRCTVFIPADALQKPEMKSAIERVVALHTPAHVYVQLRSVSRQGRIGKDCVVGLSTVIGKQPQATGVAHAQLRKNMILQRANSADPTAIQVGRISRIGVDTRVQ
jgi:phage tail-like protein